MDQLALHVRFTNASQEPFVGQERAPTETSRPLSTSPDPCGRLQSFGAARPVLRLSLALGPTVLGHTYIPLSVCDGLHVFLVLGQYFRIVVIMRLRISATIAIDPLFEIVRTKWPSTVAPARSHIGTSSVPLPTTIGAGPCKCIFFWR